MSGTDAEPRQRAVPVNAHEQREWARLRALMMRADKAWLSTIADRRWLTDSYTLLHVTGSRALWLDERHEQEIPDGHYKLTAGKGLVKIDSPGLVAPDVAGLVDLTERDSASWLPVSATQWTVAESDAKAMLCYAAGTSRRHPLMINEEVWTAYHDQYDRNRRETRTVRFEKDPGKPRSPFRVMLMSVLTDSGGEEIETAEVLAYVMGVTIPDGVKWGKTDAREVAQYIVNEAA